MITAYLYNSCTSCRKAAELLKDEAADFEIREFFKHPFTGGELASLLETTGLSVADLLSTRSTPYRELELASKDLGEEEIIALMLQEPRLLKRPILVSGTHVVVGYKAGEIKELVKLDRGA